MAMACCLFSIFRLQSCSISCEKTSSPPSRTVNREPMDYGPVSLKRQDVFVKFSAPTGATSSHDLRRVALDRGHGPITDVVQICSGTFPRGLGMHVERGCCAAVPSAALRKVQHAMDNAWCCCIAGLSPLAPGQWQFFLVSYGAFFAINNVLRWAWHIIRSCIQGRSRLVCMMTSNDEAAMRVVTSVACYVSSASLVWSSLAGCIEHTLCWLLRVWSRLRVANCSGT